MFVLSSPVNHVMSVVQFVYQSYIKTIMTVCIYTNVECRCTQELIFVYGIPYHEVYIWNSNSCMQDIAVNYTSLCADYEE